MSTFNGRSLALAIICIAGLAGAAGAQNLGKTITEENLSEWDISIGPDGVGLPAGKGTGKQGQSVWADNCAACHGENGKGGPAGDLVGGIGTLNTPKPNKTVGSYWPYATTIFDYIRRAMPYHAPGSLENDDIYALTAYLLSQNGIIKPDAVINAETLPEVKMPNRNGFTSYWPLPKN